MDYIVEKIRKTAGNDVTEGYIKNITRAGSLLLIHISPVKRCPLGR